MKTFIYILNVLVFFVVSTCCFASQSSILRLIDPSDAPKILSENVNQEFTAYNNSKSIGFNLDTCKNVIELVNKTYEIGVQYRSGKLPSTASIDFNGVAQMMAWSLAIQTWEKTDSSEGKSIIMQAWNNAFVKKQDFIPEQLWALYHNWDKVFLSEQCIDTFRNTTDPKTISQFCNIFGKYGEDEEEILLKEKIITLESCSINDKELNVFINPNIKAALAKISSWKLGGKRVASPAAYK